MREQSAPLATYTIELFGPRHSLDRHGVKYVASGIPEPYLLEAEENLNDLLPAGYSVQIREWDAEEEK